MLVGHITAAAGPRRRDCGEDEEAAARVAKAAPDHRTATGSLRLRRAQCEGLALCREGWALLTKGQRMKQGKRVRGKQSKPVQLFKPKAPTPGVRVDSSAREEWRAVEFLRSVLAEK